MTQEIVDNFYDAWTNRGGDLDGVPLAPTVQVRGPLADFDDAEAYRLAARRAGSILTRCRVREQFSAGDRVCSIVEWDTILSAAPVTIAEIVEVSGGQITSVESIYDAQELRASLASLTGGGQP